MSEEHRVPVQATWQLNKLEGSITWTEHLKAFEPYAARYGRSQSAGRIAERGGFSYGEIVDQLGHEPETWVAGRVRWAGPPADACVIGR